MNGETIKKPNWLEPQYRILTPYVEWPENFSDTEVSCLFIVREDTPAALRKLAAAYDCYWCQDEEKSLKLKDYRYAIGVSDTFDGMSEKDASIFREEGKVLWKLIQRGDIPSDISKWGEFCLGVHEQVNKAYPGWRDFQNDDEDEDIEED